MIKNTVSNSKDIIVYWAFDERGAYTMMDRKKSVPYMLEVEEPHSIMSILRKFRDSINPDGNDVSNILKCPAIISYAKNIFSINCPVDIDISIKDNEITTVNRSQEFFDGHIKVHNISTGYFQLSFPFYFFTEEDSLLIRQSGSQYANTDIENKLHTICGEFNIGKWFRPLSITYASKSNECDIKIAKNDSLFFIEFFTDKNIILKRFQYTPEIHTYAKYCLGHKHMKSKLPLVEYFKTIYEVFTKSKVKNLILKNIKSNLYI